MKSKLSKNIVLLLDCQTADDEASNAFLEETLDSVFGSEALENNNFHVVPVTTQVMYSAKERKNHIKECLPKVIEEVTSLKPSLIIAFGNITLPASSLSPKPEGITSFRGKITQSDLYNCPVVATTDVRNVLREPKELEAFTADMVIAAKCFFGTFVEEPTFKIHYLHSKEDVDFLIETSTKSGSVAYDHETSGLLPYKTLLGTSCFYNGYKEEDVPVVFAYARYNRCKPNTKNKPGLEEAMVEFYKGAVTHYDFIGFNTPFDDWVTEECVYSKFKGSTYDLRLFKYGYNSERPHSLKSLVATYLGYADYDGPIVAATKKTAHSRNYAIDKNTPEGEADYRLLKLLGYEPAPFVKVTKAGKKVVSDSNFFAWPDDLDRMEGAYLVIELDKLLHYNCLDALYTYEGFNKFYDLCEKEGLMDQVYFRHVMSRNLWKAEQFGIKLDVEENRRMHNQLQEYTEQITSLIKKQVRLIDPAIDPDTFNPNSDNQLRDVIFGKTGVVPILDRKYLHRYFKMPEEEVHSIADMVEEEIYGDYSEVRQLLLADDFDYDSARDALIEQFHVTTGNHLASPKIKDKPLGLTNLAYDPVLLTKTGLPSLSKSSLLSLLKQKKHDLLQLILMLRKTTKLDSTFVDGIYKKLRPDGRLSTKYDPCGASTGRISSGGKTSFNGQNFPKNCRGQFIADEGYKIVSWDYSSAEVRVWAALSQDPALMNVINSEDIHRATASKIFNKKEEDVTKDERQVGKMAVFLTIYQGGADKLALATGLTVSRAQEVINSLRDAFVMGIEWMDEQIEQASNPPFYVSTVFGTRKHTTNILSSDKQVVAKTQRQAVNAPIQGTAGELPFYIIDQVNQKCIEKKWKNVRFIGTVHDEVSYMVPDNLVTIITEVIDGKTIEKYEGPFIDLVNEVHSVPIPYPPLDTVTFPIEFTVGNYWAGKPSLMDALKGRDVLEEFRYDLLDELKEGNEIEENDEEFLYSV